MAVITPKRPPKPKPQPTGRILPSRLIVVSRDQHGNRLWLKKAGGWTSRYDERGRWDSLPALKDVLGSAPGEILKDPVYLTN